MASSRALPDLVARIRVDSTGVDSALGNLVGGLGRANLAMIGLGAALGLLVVGGKSMVEFAEKQEAANQTLEQAISVNHKSKASLADYEKQIRVVIDANRSYISSQSELTTAFATLIRTGLTRNEVTKDISRAVDLSAIKHISLADAVTVVQQAEQGRLRGLIDLGIASKDFVDKNGKVLTGAKLVAAAMADLDQKTKGGRNTLSQLTQDQNRLSNDWQDLSEKGGPVLLTLLDKVTTGIEGIYDWFDKVGKDDNLWSAISDRLVKIAQWIHDWVLVPLGYLGIGPLAQSEDNLLSPTNALNQDPQGSHGKQFRAAGGPVVPFGRYTVGESGPEELVMGARGGYVIPGSSGRGGGGLTVIVNVAGHVQTERSLNLAIREGLRRLDREHR